MTGLQPHGGRPLFPNSAWVSAPERFVLAGGAWARLRLPVRYGRFDHPIGGACLIDTGYSGRVTEGPRGLALRAYAGVLRPQLTPEALPGGLAPDTILISHLHADHISALKDFPGARLLAHGGGVAHWLGVSRLARVRHGVFDELLPDDFAARVEPFEALPLVAAPLGLGPGWDVFGDGSVLAIPLPGHMRGHVGFCWPRLARPLLYAADAQWLAGAILQDRPPGPPARWIIDSIAEDRATRARIAAFVAAGGELRLCHDPEDPR
jgi:glyoxylase-like metal-dependent hydrolase (beta-lactamase superfamily II)